MIPKYDRDNSFFYLDPPYYNCEDYYGKEIFSKTDFKTLAELLNNVKGKFLLSLNDTPEVREIFKAFKIEETREIVYSCSRKSRPKISELFISNY